jgi:hypothetical protein
MTVPKADGFFYFLLRLMIVIIKYAFSFHFVNSDPQMLVTS